MSVGLEYAILNTMDDSMKDFLQSEKYQRQQDEIGRLTEELRTTLNSDQNKKLMHLMDKINECDGKFASEAYITGFTEGIALRYKFIK